MSGRCLADVWPMSGRCLADVWPMSGDLQEIGRRKKKIFMEIFHSDTFCHPIFTDLFLPTYFYRPIFTYCHFDSMPFWHNVPASVELPPASVELPPASVELPPASVELPPASVELPPSNGRMVSLKALVLQHDLGYLFSFKVSLRPVYGPGIGHK